MNIGQQFHDGSKSKEYGGTVKNNYAMIPFYTLFMRFYDRFAATDFGAVSSYSNELLFLGLSLILASFVMVSLTKKLFNMNVKE